MWAALWVAGALCASGDLIAPESVIWAWPDSAAPTVSAASSVALRNSKLGIKCNLDATQTVP